MKSGITWVALPVLFLCVWNSGKSHAIARESLQDSGQGISRKTGFVFVCSKENDLFRALGSPGRSWFAQKSTALAQAPKGSAVLLLSDSSPEQRPTLTAAELEVARSRHLTLFIETPAAVPGLEFGPPRTAVWERIVVASDRLRLPRLSILTAHSCSFLPVSGECAPDLVLARVAGYNRALFGLPEKDTFPILFRLPGHNVIVATTRLSQFVTGRFAPFQDWEQVWNDTLRLLNPHASFQLNCEPVVSSAFGPDEPLPSKFQLRSFRSAASWFLHNGLLVHESEAEGIAKALLAGEESIPRRNGMPEGDGRHGILEGYASGILPDGLQLRRLPLRADCNAESAMVLALGSLLDREKHMRNVSSNLLDFVFFNSGMCQGVRADPKHPAYGLIGWGDIAPAWLVGNYGDDNARAMLATALTGASLRTARWNEPLLRALLANLRTTGTLGFRGDRVDIPPLEQNGWTNFFRGAPVNYSPHFESYLWAAYLWAYRQTGYPLFLERSRTAIGMTMKAYPSGWRWKDNLERAHMLLCLAWLVRVENTPEHRAWLDRIAQDLLAHQQACGGIREFRGGSEGAFFQAPKRNEDYGTTETPLLQENGDPVNDQLYTTGFALLGLHEAFGATRDPRWKSAEDRLATFLCRIQTRSEKLPWLSGTWFRAFDDQRWEAWASSADVGWGAWSVESGWGQAWIPAVLGLRELETTFWDFTASVSLREAFPRLREEMGLP